MVECMLVVACERRLVLAIGAGATSALHTFEIYIHLTMTCLSKSHFSCRYQISVVLLLPFVVDLLYKYIDHKPLSCTNAIVIFKIFSISFCSYMCLHVYPL